jgi:DNA-binding MarR family transcriptional regulator
MKLRSPSLGADPDYPLDPPLDLLQRFWQLSHAFERLSMHMEARIGITAQQRLVLRCVGKYPGIAASQLASILQLDRGTVSATLKRLEVRGLLQRRHDPRDRRRISLGLTAAGRALNEPTEGTVEHAVQLLLSEVGPDDITRTKAVLRRLSELVEAERVRGSTLASPLAPSPPPPSIARTPR